MDANKQIMARNISDQLIKNNVTATDVCKALGFKQNTFSDWVNAKTYPRIDAIEKMARYFDIPKSQLVEHTPDVVVCNNEEMEFLIEFRNADKSTREMIKRLLAYESGTNK